MRDKTDMNLVRNNQNCTRCIFRKAPTGLGPMCDYTMMMRKARRDPVSSCTKRIVISERKDGKLVRNFVKTCGRCGERFIAHSANTKTCPKCKGGQ